MGHTTALAITQSVAPTSEVRSIPAASTASPTPQEEAMICDIQRLLSRLVGKAPQLIGMLLYSCEI